jgi:SagB-type dehydrogenase family enzyme
MTQTQPQVTRDYLEAVFARRRKPIEPEGFHVNWMDQPSRFKVYLDAARCPLPSAVPRHLLSLHQVYLGLRTPPPRTAKLEFDDLATMLHYANGILTRRLGAHWNGDSLDRTRHSQAAYSRGTPSGGGMYPTEIYLVCGPGLDLKPGIYHYNNCHQALDRLWNGDLRPAVHSALLGHPAAASGSFLLLTLFFWKNSFKYNNFSYHVVTQDLGAMAASLRLLALGFGSDLEFVLWFRDETLNHMLGLSTDEESIFAVIPLPLAGGHSVATVADSLNSWVASPPPSPVSGFQLQRSYFQRSRNVVRFPMVENVHRASLVDEEPRPLARLLLAAKQAESSVGGRPIELPEMEPQLLELDLLAAFRGRQSSFGRFTSSPALSLRQLATVLAFGAQARHYRTDLKLDDGTPALTRLMVFVNHVEGLGPGAYSYDARSHCLSTIREDDLCLFLQHNYFLRNYNLQQCAAVITVVGHVEAVLRAFGNRGYRVLNFEVGIVAQSIYLAASGMSIGCGAVLGFDNLNLDKVLGLDGIDYRSLLFLLVGHQNSNPLNYEFRLG